MSRPDCSSAVTAVLQSVTLRTDEVQTYIAEIHAYGQFVCAIAAASESYSYGLQHVVENLCDVRISRPIGKLFNRYYDAAVFSLQTDVRMVS